MKYKSGDVVSIGNDLCLLYANWNFETNKYELSNLVLSSKMTRKGGLIGEELIDVIKNKEVVFNLAEVLDKIINE